MFLLLPKDQTFIFNYISSIVKIGLPVLEKKILSGFYHILAQQQSWSFDLDFGIKFSLPLPRDAPHKISV